ncbi:PRKC apoptosis WT1 regulator protein-like [Bombina bombina]|uniref:PRKC apoptosis WT1 regulator protein-like n=1 Tax=Bombina bombina TaxID=8345 RepID=UPI00235AD01C|nr:PRKC apoptosis WT1 regulator protein-like [Bombina bombina]
MSRNGKGSSTDQAPFMEEWKARRERMRLRSSSSSSSISLSVNRSVDHSVSYHEVDHQTHQKQEQIKELSGKSTEAPSKSQAHDDMENKLHDSTSSKINAKKGNPQKKHLTQIEKRKLREKRRPTGVANITPVEDNEDSELNEEININNQELSRPQGICSVSKMINKQRVSFFRHENMDSHNNAQIQEERENSQNVRQCRLKELQKAVEVKQQDNHKLSTELSDKEQTVLQLQKDMNNLTQKLQIAEDENKTLKDENQMLLKMMGQLSS